MSRDIKGASPWLVRSESLGGGIGRRTGLKPNLSVRRETGDAELLKFGEPFQMAIPSQARPERFGWEGVETRLFRRLRCEKAALRAAGSPRSLRKSAISVRPSAPLTRLRRYELNQKLLCVPALTRAGR